MLSFFSDVYSAGLYLRDNQVMIHGAPYKPHKPSSSGPALQQHDNYEVVDSNDDNGAAIDVSGSITNAYKRRDICVRIDQIRYVQHNISGVDPVHTAELEANFLPPRQHLKPWSHLRHRCKAWCRAADLFHELDCKEARRMELQDVHHVGVVDRDHRLNLLTTLHQPTYMALQSRFGQIHVSYISRE